MRTNKKVDITKLHVVDDELVNVSNTLESIIENAELRYKLQFEAAITTTYNLINAAFGDKADEIKDIYMEALKEVYTKLLSGEIKPRLGRK